MSDSVPPVSVIVPTAGRCGLLESCVRSVLACDPPAHEVLVIDQSHADDVSVILDQLGAASVRRVECDGTGTARAMNRGLAAATYDRVVVTHDDCTVRPDWIGVATRLLRAHPDAIITGRVLPAEGSGYVPSTKTDPEPHDYTGTVTSGVLYPANMTVDRRGIQSIGGFDERRSLLVAEDNDLCYRWLAAGRALRYEPDLVVWHHDWRSTEQLVRTHVAYARAQGAFYAKHVHDGDLRILRLLRWDLVHGMRTVVRGAVRGEPRWQDPYREMVWSLLVGLAIGWREARLLEREPLARSAG
jgi:GT2 family glycosyltransferase